MARRINTPKSGDEGVEEEGGVVVGNMNGEQQVNLTADDLNTAIDIVGKHANLSSIEINFFNYFLAGVKQMIEKNARQ